MKKIIFSIFIFLCFMLNIKSDGNVPPVQMNLLEDFYSKISKTYNNGVFTFEYTNNLLTIDLSDSQLKKLLSQKSNGSRLTYYETLKILVTPVEGTPYESLKGKTKVYRANNGGSWINNINNYESEMEDVAELFNLDYAYWPWGTKLQYRLNESDSWISTVPAGKDLTNKTLEEQIATIFDINLENNPNGVIDLYPNRLRFNPLPNGYIYAVRFDFFDEKNTPPVLKEDSTTEYLTSSLKHLGTEYVIIKYGRTEEAVTTKIIENDKKTSSFLFDKAWLIPTGIIIIGIISFIVYYIRYKVRVIK